jgi:hypothetical protein
VGKEEIETVRGKFARSLSCWKLGLARLLSREPPGLVKETRLRDFGPRLLIELQHGEVSVSRHGVIARVLALSKEDQ